MLLKVLPIFLIQSWGWSRRELPFVPQLQWDVDTGLLAFVLAAGRDLQQEIAALKH